MGCSFLLAPPPLCAAEPPKDKYNAAYLIITFLGAGFLLPWNGFLSAVDYFAYTYPEVNMESLFSVVYMPSLLFCVVLTIFFGQRVPLSVRFVGGYSLLFVVVIVTMFIKSVGFQLFLVFFMGFGAYQRLLVVDFFPVYVRSKLPPAYTGGLMTGIGVAGIVTAALRIITKAVLPDYKASFLLYFGIGAVAVAFCIVLWFVLQRLPIVRYYRSDQALRESVVNDRPVADEGVDTKNGDADELMAKKESAVSFLPPQDEPKTPSSEYCAVDNDVSISFEKEDKKGVLLKYLRRVGVVLWVVKVPFVSVFITFFITLSLFPGVISVIEPQPNSTFSGESKSWFSVLLVAVFQVADFVGRFVTKWSVTTKYMVFPKSELRGFTFIVTFTLLRMIFFPCVILFVHPRVLVGDVFALIMIGVFALSNGYVGSAAMMMGPEILCRAIERNAGSLKKSLEGMTLPSMRELAGTVMGFGLMSGLTAGAVCGASIVPAITGNATAA